MDPQLRFGSWLRQRRRALDLTQRELADLVACAPVSIQKIEGGRLRPSKELAERLAYHLAVAPEERLDFVERARGRAKAHEDESRAAPSSTLPQFVTSLVGRAESISWLVERLGAPATRLLTLVGAPGVGKTRLALATAEQVAPTVADGAAFVPLADIADPALVADEIARQLGIEIGRKESPHETLKQRLRRRELLLILDNFEHLLPAAPLVGELLAAAPRLTILVTSREPLHLSGERLFTVAPLPAPAPDPQLSADAAAPFAAVRLFVERARAAQGDFALTESAAPAIGRLCHALDGLPLALELAAARTRHLSPQAMVARLAERFTWLTDGPRDFPDRHRTLRAAIDWSYELLDSRESSLFRRLGIFAGRFTLDSAAAVCDIEQRGSMLSLLAALVDKSLVVPHADGGESVSFSMLESIRAYAREALLASEEVSLIRARYRQYFVALAEAGDAGLRGAEHSRWLARLEREHANLRAALDSAMRHGDEALALRLAGALAWFWEMSGRAVEGRERVEAALALAGNDWFPDEARGRLLARALNGAGRLALVQTDLAASRRYLEQGMALCQQLEEESLMLLLLHNLGNVLLAGGRPDEGEAHFAESLALGKELDDPWGTAWAHMGLGHIALYHDQLARAQRHFEESLALRRGMEDRWGIARSLTELGITAYRRAALEEAERYLKEAGAIHRELGHRGFFTWTTHNLGMIRLREGRLDESESFLREALELFVEQGRQVGIRHSLLAMSLVAAERGDEERAARFLGALDGVGTRMTHAHSSVSDPSEPAVHALRERLKEPRLARAYREGCATPLDELLQRIRRRAAPREERRGA